MIRINLLPVRATRRKKAVERELVMFFIGLIVIIALSSFSILGARAQQARHAQEQVNLKADIEDLRRIVGEVDIFLERKQELEQKLEVDGQADFDGDVYCSSGDVYFDNGTASQLHLPVSQQYALEIRNPNTPMLTFDSRGGTNPGLVATSQVAFAMTTTAQTLNNSQLHIGLNSDTEMVFTVKGSDGTTRTATLTLS